MCGISTASFPSENEFPLRHSSSLSNFQKGHFLPALRLPTSAAVQWSPSNVETRCADATSGRKHNKEDDMHPRTMHNVKRVVFVRSGYIFLVKTYTEAKPGKGPELCLLFSLIHHHLKCSSPLKLWVVNWSLFFIDDEKLQRSFHAFLTYCSHMSLSLYIHNATLVAYFSKIYEFYCLIYANNRRPQTVFSNSRRSQ